MSSALEPLTPSSDSTTNSAGAQSSPTPSTSRGVQLKRSLAGQAFDVQMAQLVPVQRKGGEDTGAVHDAAAHGISSGGGALPFAAKIQQSFGGHDVGNVQAHTGGAATEASAAMGAQAYATGDHVAFGSAPDLHTAAHEAAHVVQQRAGVSISGGVGQTGDTYEKHADAVADAVVQGKSAEPLLSGMSGAPAVQKRAIQREVQRTGPPAPVTPPPKPTTDAEYEALAGYRGFETNVMSFGLPATLALSCWKQAMDQLYTNTAQYEAIKSDAAAVLAWVDSSPARAGYQRMAEALLAAKPLDTSKSYALWSGKPSQNYAETQGHQVLESGHLGKLFDDVRIVFSEWNVCKTLWRAISDVYARQIGTLMEGKKIQVYQRKKGDIFAEVESVALTQIGQTSGIPPQYEFHPLTTVGCFGGEWDYEAPYANDVWRKSLTAVKNDAALAKSKAEANGVRIFDYSSTVPVGVLIDQGSKGSASEAGAVIDAHNADILTKCQATQTALQAP